MPGRYKYTPQCRNRVGSSSTRFVNRRDDGGAEFGKTLNSAQTSPGRRTSPCARPNVGRRLTASDFPKTISTIKGRRAVHAISRRNINFHTRAATHGNTRGGGGGGGAAAVIGRAYWRRFFYALFTRFLRLATRVRTTERRPPPRRVLSTPTSYEERGGRVIVLEANRSRKSLRAQNTISRGVVLSRTDLPRRVETASAKRSAENVRPRTATLGAILCVVSRLNRCLTCTRNITSCPSGTARYFGDKCANSFFARGYARTTWCYRGSERRISLFVLWKNSSFVRNGQIFTFYIYSAVVTCCTYTDCTEISNSA